MTFTARTVEHDGVRIATRDHGGSGPDLVLMHGGGMEQGSFALLLEHLVPAFRVITFDFRGHGGSSDAPWTLASAAADLRAVIEAYGLDAPVVAGHSLGGMVALLHGSQHPCRGVVNIDGHGRGRVDQYVGYDEAEVRLWWDEQHQKFDRLTTGVVATVLRGLLVALRKSPTSATTARQVNREVTATDVFALYPRISSPLLVFNATSSAQPSWQKVLAGPKVSMVSGFRQGLGRDLDALAAGGQDLEVVTVDATHMLIRTHPELVAQRISDFLLTRPAVTR